MSREYVQAVMDIICGGTCSEGHYGVDHGKIHDEFVAWHNANLAPISQPKPPEPMGLGAVVVDRDGSELVRVERNGERPWRAGGGHRFSWDDIDFLADVSPGADPLADWEIDLLRGVR